MLAFMGNCLSSWKKGNGKGCKKVTLAMLGLDNAGKTVTAKGLQGVPRDMVAPTVGFDSVDFRFLQCDVTMFDLGGGVRIRDIWKNYLAEIYGIVFVVDSSEPDRMEECRQTLTDLLQQPKVAGKPILLLANKQDKPGALDEVDICEYLNLEDVVNKTRCPCKLKTCAALSGEGKKMDPSIGAGLKWLLTMICNDYEQLHKRVVEDMEDQRKREADEKKARQERVRKMKEEREKEEAIQRANHGEGDRPDDDDDDDEVLGDNPFKRLDLNELKEKEKKQKQQKKRRKEQEAQKTKEEEVVVARGNMFNSPLHNAATASDDDIPRSQINGDMTLPTSRSSPLQSLLPSETLGDRVSGGGDKSVLPPVPKSRSIEAYGSTFEPGNLQNGTNGLKFGATHVVASVSRLEPLESVSKKYRKKKKKKRNQTVPKDEDNDSMETDTQKGHHSSKVPSSEATPETKVSDFSQKWGLVDELPSLDSANYNRPNYEDDENIIT